MCLKGIVYKNPKVCYTFGEYKEVEEFHMRKSLFALLLGVFLFLSMPGLSEPLKTGDRLCLGQWAGEDLTFSVIETEPGRALLLCDSAIGLAMYNEDNKDVTWEKSSLRAFLNGDFYASAFTSEEKAQILSTVLETPSSFGTEGGSPTTDYLFLLTPAEVERLLPTRWSRKVSPGPAVRTDASYSPVYDNTITWWLRSPGVDQKHAAAVDFTGRIQSHGIKAMLGVRPALYLGTH